MWNLWTLQKETGTRASDLLQIPQWVAETYGLDGWWAAYCFDDAVTYVGRWIEAKMSELDKRGKRLHELADLLQDTPHSIEIELKRWAHIQGIGKVIKVDNT